MGGRHPEWGECYTSVEYYSITEDKWTIVDNSLHEARHSCSTCCLGDNLFCYGGISRTGYLGSIERLDAFKIVNGQYTQWEIINLNE